MKKTEKNSIKLKHYYLVFKILIILFVFIQRAEFCSSFSFFLFINKDKKERRDKMETT